MYSASNMSQYRIDKTEINSVHVIFSSVITLYQNNILTCSQEIKFSKLGMAEQGGMGEGVNRSVGVLSGTVELLCCW